MTRFLKFLMTLLLTISITPPVQAALGLVEIGENDFQLSASGLRASYPALAYNQIENNYLVVWRLREASNHYEIYGQLFSVEGLPLGLAFSISNMGQGDSFNDPTSPMVTWNSVLNQYLVVWRSNEGVSDTLEVFGQRLNALGAAIGDNDFRISHMGPDGDPNYRAVSPDLVYNPNSNEYLVVWYGYHDLPGLALLESEIWGQRLDSNAAPLGGNFRISDMGPNLDPDYHALYPSVEYNVIANQYLVIWCGNENVPGLTELQIFGQRLNATGIEIGDNDFQISNMGNGVLGYGACSSDLVYNAQSDEYLVVWRSNDQEPYVSTWDIFGQRLNALGVEIGEDDFRISDMGPEGDANYSGHAPTLAWNPVHQEYLVVWYGDDDKVGLVKGEYEIFGQRLNALGAAIGDNDFRISDMGPDGNTGYSAYFPAVVYNAVAEEYLLVWHGNDEAEEGPFIFGQRLTNSDCGNAVLDVGEDCEDGNNLNGDGCSATCILEEVDEGIGETTGGTSNPADEGQMPTGGGCSLIRR